ncbi:MAG TPA: sterol desaturase family protein [Dyella sp.]|uniref:sterol desaturase family protein n=1 Tax=Dyella sp. TaxID=1869338 RepID=UPI002CDD1AAE|nr:sterol desaturase family protein [Dyella sp.]HTV85837.1 sterol desaturase family protein [Dyella sp.]
MIPDILQGVLNGIGSVQTMLFTDVVQPALYHFGFMDYDEDAYDAIYWVLVGALQILFMYALLRPLEAWRPAEPWSDRKATRVDILYTWITKLGLFNLVFFVLLQPAFDRLQSSMVLHGIPTIELDAMWPGLTDRPLVSFFLYLIVLDFAGYWYHRWQHRFGVWWELHAVHHSQRQMSLWTDDRNHALDTLIQSAFFAALALLIGVEPSQYVWLVAFSNLLQSVQHINAHLPFRFGLRRLLVSPAFHRRHHAIGYGHEGTHYGCNFGVLFPWWDMLFKTASWNEAPESTGIRDQLQAPAGTQRCYGEGWWSQQYLAFMRIAQRMGHLGRGNVVKN